MLHATEGKCAKQLFDAFVFFVSSAGPSMCCNTLPDTRCTLRVTYRFGCERGTHVAKRRPHEYECFRKDGILQYWYERKRLRKETGLSENAEVFQEAAVTKEEYQEVVDAMVSSTPTQKKIAPKLVRLETP